MAHGTVSDLNDLPEFLATIRRGRPAPPGVLDELRERYAAIGGSPLLSLTEAQAAGLSHELGVPVHVAMRLWHPFVEEVVPELTELDTLCVLPLAPFSVHVYRAAAERAIASVPGAPEAVFVEPWGQEPEFISTNVEFVRVGVETDTSIPIEETAILLTAHSLPTRIIESGDPYAEQFVSTAQAVERALGFPCRIAYQSQGVDGGDWMGPSLEEVMIEVAGTGARRVVVAPIGFLADHVETLYDLDVAAAAQAELLGLSFTRVPALNDAPGFLRALASVVRRTMGEDAEGEHRARLV